ncbi:hypothetical protein K443DRAFT_582531 [Laccaria amethystina LaAM-08-1]|uniref:Uncharacterized protein n=1 Tax=Laccaria amethystina LaAM-08-1 TaxID=1095629 RepID=A0A0C9XZ07_9AGAR|nr:hypothetical protein K443DRAFT_582531 [Laccaria amethystina LaAM-08-1]
MDIRFRVSCAMSSSYAQLMMRVSHESSLLHWPTQFKRSICRLVLCVDYYAKAYTPECYCLLKYGFIHWIAHSLNFQVIKRSRRLFPPRLSCGGCRGTQMRPHIFFCNATPITCIHHWPAFLRGC